MKETIASNSRVQFLHMFTLAAFAIAQPLLDLLGATPEFFTMRQLDGLDAAFLALFLLVLLPALLCLPTLLVLWIHRTTAVSIFRTILFLLVCAIGLQIAKKLGLSLIPSIGCSVTLGIAFSWGYAKNLHVRQFLSFLSVCLVVFPLFFFGTSNASSLFRKEKPVEIAELQFTSTPPVIVIILDEIPVSSLMNAEGQINRFRYPNFARLADRATWFRNGTTVGNGTHFAVPSILDGRYPTRETLLGMEDRYPANLFTLLGSVYDIYVSGPIVALCPDGWCRNHRPGFIARTALLIQDLRIVYLHMITPEEFATALPPVGHTWKGFGGKAAPENNAGDGEEPEAKTKHQKWVGLILEGIHDRPAEFERFIEEIRPGRRPKALIMHVELPHTPYSYLPSGTRYRADETELFGMNDLETWGSDQLAADQSQQRYLLQLEFLDSLLGKALDRLEKEQMFDDSLIVVTADHGVSFRINDKRREPTSTNLSEIMAVPFFWKAPGQRNGRVTDFAAQTIDIPPTIAATLGVTFPWGIDGKAVSMDNLDGDGPQERTIHYGLGGHKAMTADPAELDEKFRIAAKTISIFGDGQAPNSIYELGSHRELIGREIGELPIKEDVTHRCTLNDPELFEQVNTSSGFVPAFVRGRQLGDWAEPTGHPNRPIAVVLNGTVRATAEMNTIARTATSAAWSVVIPERYFVDGRNLIQLYLISQKGDAVSLSPCHLDTP
jgi:hypothetical protein